MFLCNIWVLSVKTNTSPRCRSVITEFAVMNTELLLPVVGYPQLVNGCGCTDGVVQCWPVVLLAHGVST